MQVLCSHVHLCITSLSHSSTEGKTFHDEGEHKRRHYQFHGYDFSSTLPRRMLPLSDGEQRVRSAVTLSWCRSEKKQRFTEPLIPHRGDLPLWCEKTLNLSVQKNLTSSPLLLSQQTRMCFIIQVFFTVLRSLTEKHDFLNFFVIFSSEGFTTKPLVCATIHHSSP